MATLDEYVRIGARAQKQIEAEFRELGWPVSTMPKISPAIVRIILDIDADQEAKPALHAGATALIRQAQRQRWFGDEKKAECKADAAVLRALAEMGEGE